MSTQKLLIAAALSACSCTVFAQWQWVDDSGRKVFSDRPPPADISPTQIIKQPYAKPSASNEVRYPSADDKTPDNAHSPADPAPSPVKQAQQASTAQAQEDAEKAANDKAVEEANRKAQEEQKKHEAQQAKLRQENCQRAQAAQASLQSGALHSHTNEKGERGIMTEPQRQAALQRTQRIIKENCK
ncbi:DUF4124 domain-containing protein [Comamonas sp. NoAH]|uniref:DUF4124 domain-containing protein n=1 Tax=Comamonas halotolerans TaxID=3041496 RepID=UPI0024E11100|nr:DUF4124 domain-containing protein [Comamonas sp. NoAH]